MGVAEVVGGGGGGFLFLLDQRSLAGGLFGGSQNQPAIAGLLLAGGARAVLAGCVLCKPSHSASRSRPLWSSRRVGSRCLVLGGRNKVGLASSY